MRRAIDLLNSILKRMGFCARREVVWVPVGPGSTRLVIRWKLAKTEEGGEDSGG